MLYWIEVVPNPWVRGIAIAITGTAWAVAYFYEQTAPPIEAWTWAYGVCSGLDDGNNYE